LLVIEQAKALALRLNNPERVLATIPTAKQLDYQGANLVVAPHRTDEVTVLRNLGFDVPAPIEHYYSWPGRFTPYAHQRETSAFLTTNRRGLVLNDIGTGKTQSALWAADYMLTSGEINKVLIVSPLSTLERVWGDSIFLGFPNRKFEILHGTAERRRKLLKKKADFYIINHDGLGIITEELDDIDLVIIDEAAVYRNPRTKRYKTLKKWIDKHPDTRMWMMTGTPTPNAPTDAWALAKLIDSPNLSQTYTGFRDATMIKISQFKWVPRDDATDTTKHILQPSVRFKRDDCFDLPETVVQERQVPLTPEQNKHYKNMLDQFLTEFTATSDDDGVMSAANEAVRMSKLLQISCGVAYSDEKTSMEIDCAPRLNLVKEIVEEAGEKCIVFAPFVSTLAMLERELSKHWTVGVVNGSVSSNKRNVIFQNFQEARDPHILIAHPATMAHGLTLTSASTIIWYGPTTSNETYVQANGRIERIGKNKV